jgi:hypothetical protein
MAEPARKLNNPPQDDHGWQPRVITGGGEGGGEGERPNLRSIEGGGGTIETPNQEAAHGGGRHLSLVPPLNDTADGLNVAERVAANQLTPKSNIADQEKTASPLGSVNDLYRQSKENRKAGGKRGIFIGLGAGGGLLSVVAGISFMLPFKLPGIMHTITDHAGSRLERVVTRRAERIFIKYVFDGDKIATGNPIGDLFANLRTTKFEVKLKEQHGLSFERAPNGNVRIVHDGTDLGNFKNADQLYEFLGRDDLNTKELRQVFRLVVGNEKSIFKFWQRAKFVKWLRLKFNIPRFGTREQKPGETDQDFSKNILEEQNNVSAKSTLENVADFSKCLEGNCTDINKTGGVNELEDSAKKVLNTATKDLATEALTKAGAKTSMTISKKAAALMLAAAGGLSIPFFGEIDTAARAMHLAEQTIDSDLPIVAHAKYATNAAVQFATTIAGYADQGAAGLLPSATQGLLASQFDGMEESQSFNLIDRGLAIGTGLDGLEKINETVQKPAFAGVMTTMFDTVGWVARGPLDAWYYTISKAVDFIGASTIGKLTEFIANSPAGKAALALIQPFITNITEGLLKFLGMAIDATVTGAKRHLFTTQGMTAAFDAKAKDMGMRKLTESQAQVVDAQIRTEHAQELADMPLTERLFDLNNSDSLASRLAESLPSSAVSNPITTLASASMRLVANAPIDLATATTGTAYAANAPSLESLFGTNAYGGLDSDLSPDVSPGAYTPGLNCPDNDPSGNSFNTCNVDREVADSWSCAEVNCSDLDTPAPAATGTAAPVPSGDTKQLAAAILKNSNITFEPGASDGAFQDVTHAALDGTTTCRGVSVPIAPALLQALLAAATKYRFRINAMVSDHEPCVTGKTDTGFHPKGKAADIGMVNGVDIKPNTITNASTLALYRQFAIDMSAGMTGGGRFGQEADPNGSPCIGKIALQNGVTQFNDTCSHLHVDVP